MTGNWKFIADITHYGAGSPSPVEPICEYVLKFGERYNVVLNGIWLARQEQLALLPNGGDISIEECNSKLSPTGLLEKIANLSPNGSASDSLIVFSYDREGLTAITQHFSGVIPISIPSLPGAAKPGQPKPAELTPDTRVGNTNPPLTYGEAVRVVKNVLRKKGAFSATTGLHMPQLRMEMIELDKRTKKDDSDYVSKNLVSLILRDGQEHGWLMLDRSRGPGREHVYLTEMEPLIEQPVRPSPVLAVPAAEETKPPEKQRGRDRIMIDALCAKGIAMWTPGELREFLCSALGERITGNTAINVQSLVEAITLSAKQKTEQSQYPYATKWDALGQCFLRNLIAAEVLIDDHENVIKNQWTAGAKKVLKLADNWELRVEGALVLAILKNVENVTLEDAYSLALALYQRGQGRALKTTELHHKIAVVIEFLEQTGAIAIDGAKLSLLSPKQRAAHA